MKEIILNPWETVENIFYDEGWELHPYEFIPEDNVIAKRATWLFSMMSECKKIKQEINFLKKNLDHELQSSIRKSFIISYGKIFASTKWRWAWISINEIKKEFTEEMMNEHKRLIEIRNKHIAHAENVFEVNKVMLIFSHDKKEILDTYYSRQTLCWEVPEKYNLYLKMINVIDKVIEWKWEIVDKKLLELYKL